jgi:phospho-N-acetylmuramoyl-pentapeptide-transferase
MLFWLHNLSEWFSPLRMFEYTSFRVVAAVVTAFTLGLLCGYRIKNVSGGILLIISVPVSSLVWVHLQNLYVVLAVFTFLWFGMTELRCPQGSGRTAHKVVGVLFLSVMLCLFPDAKWDAQYLYAPFVKDPIVVFMGGIGVFLYLLAFVCGSVHAVEITSGMDGISVPGLGLVDAALLVMAYAAGHAGIARYLHVPFLVGANELSVFCGALLGGLLGVFWFNMYPATLHLGHCGHAAAAASLAIVAVIIKQELVLPLIGGVYVYEHAYALFRGKRNGKEGSALQRDLLVKEIRRCRERGDCTDSLAARVSTKYLIISVVLAAAGMATLKFH